MYIRIDHSTPSNLLHNSFAPHSSDFCPASGHSASLTAPDLCFLPRFASSPSRIVPEYSFLDARGLGAYEGQRIETLREVGLGTQTSNLKLNSQLEVYHEALWVGALCAELRLKNTHCFGNSGIKSTTSLNETHMVSCIKVDELNHFP